MRDLSMVIDEMLEYIPNEHVDLINMLNDRKESFWYTAPEAIWLRWDEVSDILNTFLANEKFEGWALCVYNIWVDKKEEY